MKNNLFRNLLFGTASAFILCLSSEVNAAPVNTTDYWKQFRQNYPFHFQSLLISKPSAGGKRTLIISEPPPHFLPSNADQTLKKAFGTMYAGVKERKHPIGFNGWVRDYVVTLVPPAGASAEAKKRQVKDGIAALTYMLHGTSYKAHALQLPVKEPQNLFKAPPNVSITPGELKSWVTNPSSFYVSVNNEETVSFKTILDKDLSGVFLSKEEGIAILVIPRSSDLSNYRSDIRKFTLDSDLILGSLVKERDNALVIVGQERKSNLTNNPPLRTETILRLAAIKDESLYQSLEANHILAGRFIDKGNDLDWGPNFLSKSLVNTELGSLLTKTDILLKSWSEGGRLRVAKFPYPEANKYPFKGQSLIDKVGSIQLLYNWNTAGLGTIYDSKNYDVYTQNNTGSLPITYGSDLKKPGIIITGNLSKYEKEAYEYFYRQENIHVTQVAQYTALYQIFKAFPVKNFTWHTSVNSKDYNRVTSFLALLILRDLENIEKNKNILSLIESAYKMHGNNNYNRQKIEVDIIEKRRFLRNIKNKLGDKILIDIAFLLNNTNFIEIIKNDQSNKLYFANKEIIELGELIRFFSRKKSNIDIFNIASKYNPPSNIKTSTIIVSSYNDGNKFSKKVGGHNLDSRTTRIIEDPNLPKGKVNVNQNSNEVDIYINPKNASNSSALARIYAENEGKPDLEQQLNSELSNSQPPRTIAKALDPNRADGISGLSESEIPGLDGESASIESGSLKLTNEQLEAIQAFAKEQNLDLYIELTPEGYLIFRGYPPGFLQAQTSTTLIEVLDSGFPIKSGKIHFRNLPKGSVEGIKQTLAARANNSDPLIGRENLSSSSPNNNSSHTVFSKFIARENSEIEVLLVSRKQDSPDGDTSTIDRSPISPLQLGNKPNWSQGRIKRTVDKSSTQVDYQVNLPVPQKKDIDLQIKATSDNSWLFIDLDKGENIIQDTLTNPETGVSKESGMHG